MAQLRRVFISDSEVIRSFYWFEYGSDHSVYFGSSNAKHYRRGLTGTHTSSATKATLVDVARDGRPMLPSEVGQKYSVHGSGIVSHGVREEDGRRGRYCIAPPRDGFKFLPLVAVLPMNPKLYKVSTKRPKQDDIVIDLGPNLLPPFATLFYFNCSDELEPPPVLGAKLRYEQFKTVAVPFGPGRLCVSIYADSSQMRQWPTMEGTVLSLPDRSGGEPGWPFVGNVS